MTQELIYIENELDEEEESFHSEELQDPESDRKEKVRELMEESRVSLLKKRKQEQQTLKDLITNIQTFQGNGKEKSN